MEINKRAQRNTNHLVKTIGSGHKATIYDTVIPDTLALAERCYLALQGVANTSDPEDDNLLWFEIYWNANPPYMKHSGVDIEIAFKTLDNFCQLRYASGCEDYRKKEEGLLTFLLSCVEEDGLFWARYSDKRPWHMSAYASHGNDRYNAKQVDMALPSATGGLMSVLAVRNQLSEENGCYNDILRKMARGMESVAIKQNDYAYFPDCRVGHPFCMPRGGWLHTTEPADEHDSGEGSVVGYFGSVLQGLSKWADQSGDEQALELAGRFARFGMKPKFWGHPGDPHEMAGYEQGHVDSHFHCRCIFLRGLLRYGLVAGDRNAVDFVRSSYEHMRSWGINRIGWIPTWVNRTSRLEMETCFLGDLVALGIKMSVTGIADYWEDVDRIVRNHLVEAQITNMAELKRIQGLVYNDIGSNEKDDSGLPATARATQTFLSEEDRNRTDNLICTDNVLKRSIGIFTSYLLPTSATNDRTMQCCTANGARGLFYAWEAITRICGEDGQVNLLLNRAAPWLDVKSHLPYEGKVVVHNKKCRRIFIRIPAWVRLNCVHLQVNGIDRHTSFAGQYCLTNNLKPGDTVELDFPMAEETFNRTAHAKTKFETQYTIQVRGNTVVDISPRDTKPQHYQFYRRNHLKKGGHTPMKKVTHNLVSEIPRW
ncbi:MAG: glycoside hydrolase family 127 protein [bacterium]|nr:glycoside hydrolase family 127 protein [bacterium]